MAAVQRPALQVVPHRVSLVGRTARDSPAAVGHVARRQYRRRAGGGARAERNCERHENDLRDADGDRDSDRNGDWNRDGLPDAHAVGDTDADAGSADASSDSDSLAGIAVRNEHAVTTNARAANAPTADRDAATTITRSADGRAAECDAATTISRAADGRASNGHLQSTDVDSANLGDADRDP